MHGHPEIPSDTSAGHALKAPHLWLARNIIHLAGHALRHKLRSGYGRKDFLADLSAGCVVGLVAIPLGLALAIATGVPPQHGLYTIIFAGFLVALLGGSQLNVSGPTAAFVVVLAPIVSKFGLPGLLTAGMMAGCLMTAMGLLRLGRTIRFIPTPVVTGFTAGIAVVIGTLQLKDFFGLTVTSMPESYFGKVVALISAAPSLSWGELVVGAATLSSLIVLPRHLKRLPAPLVVLPAISLAVFLVNHFLPQLGLATIGNRFQYSEGGITHPGVPSILPSFSLPWSANNGTFSLEMMRQLFPSAVAIAMLGAIESLLSAVVADGMARTRHNPDSELFASGVGNIVAPFFGGIPATGAIARTATNFRFGGRSPVASMIHAAFTLLALLFFAPLLSYIPMAAMAALLLLVAYNMSDAKHFVHVLKAAPRGDIAVMLCCFLATVMVDMVAGVTVGLIFATFLFMGRVANLTHGRAWAQGASHPELAVPVPDGVVIYDIDGELFFGAARSATEAITATSSDVRVFILALDDVISVDFSGTLELDSAIRTLRDRGIRVILSGLRPQPAEVFRKAGLLRPDVEIVPHMNAALATIAVS